MTNAVDIRSISRSFGRTRALEDITLSVPDGSICGLFGRNGAGKTTIMSILAGQDRPTSGNAKVFGEHPFENSSTLSKISFVRDNQRYPDDYRLHHVLRIAPRFAPNWSVDVAAELVDGLRIPAKIPIKKFSRGQLSSIAIVMGLASRAPLTLLDEPYLGLDITARALFHDLLLRDYSAHPRTVILSTHLIEESEALFDRVIIIDRGRVRVDCERDEASNLAFTISGPADAVDKLSTNRRVLLTHAAGGLRSATITGEASDELVLQARTLGATISSASLPELVAAYGADAPESTLIKKGARA
ncbi:ABC transporter ATP-binding protein [Alpinimonas psychrophila]|uniref:ABC-2 type transport system ATP-binding protein n=1 Tax=Alpinimonas psychrophila TaxID=748908 RepID=A0A7W3PNF7_9MICO|nr:ABC transporter ATP-binding protein [Alpinimonas psychrophila]MBA8828407.1 ABC-2 type transport system ATP-binding protein [Alpinimonas psychrophila]